MSVLSKGQITTGVVTFAIAIGAGHLTQYGFSGTDEFQQPAPRPSSLRPSRPTVSSSSMMMHSPLLPAEKITPESDLRLPHEPGIVQERIHPAGPPLDPVTVPGDAAMLPPVQDQVRLEGFGAACDPQVSATAMSGAMIQLDLLAPCDRETSVSITHGALSFSERTDASGALTLDIPAFQAHVDLQVSVLDRKPVGVSVRVPDAIWYDRVGLMWDGAEVLSIHASGVGSSERALQPQTSAEFPGAEGVLMRLGETDGHGSKMAEVFSFPSGYVTKPDTVQFSVKATVTPSNCDKTVPVRAIRSLRGDTLRGEQLSVAFPGCGAIGQTLVLKNLLEDLKIAQN